MTNIENQEIKGLTLKAFITVLSSTILLMLGGARMYYGILNEIKDSNDALQNQVESVDRKLEENSKANALRLNTIEIRIDILEEQLKELKRK